MTHPSLGPRFKASRTLVRLVICILMCTHGAMAAPKPSVAPTKQGSFSFAIEPAPTWVVPAKEKVQVSTERAPLSYRVIDEQTRVDATGTIAYNHVVRVINESSGLGVGSQVEIEFDPSFQTLAFHHFDVVRQGKHLNRLDRKKILLLQRETQLERRMYDGRVTASFVVDDVRVGDEIDFAYSIRGSNPVFGGRHVDTAWMVSQRGPVALYQIRLIAPEARKIQSRLGGTDMQLSSQIEKGWREIVVRRDNVAQLRGDANTPYSAVMRQLVQFTEFDDWSDVARWGTALFSPARVSDGALDRKAAEIKASAPELEQQVLAALTFVQAEVRYFGTEIGPNTHQPAAPEKVLAQRFGDCKDKVTLLIALLQRLGVNASPVLVSTFARSQIEVMLPSPLAFDHVIARVELEGHTYYLDATHSHQSGPLSTRGSVGFNKGLLLASGTAELAQLPTAYDQERMVVRDTFSVTNFAQGVTLESRITYRSDFAEQIREALAARSVAEVEAQLTMPYARLYPTLKTVAAMRVEPSTLDDAVTLVLNFSIAEPWRFPEERLLVFEMVQWSLVDALRVPNDPSRSDAYAIGYPGLYRHVSVVEFADDVFSAPGSQRADDGDSHVVLRSKSEVSVRRSEFASELQLRSEEISAAEWPGYMALIAKLAPRTGVTVRMPAIGLPGLEVLKKEIQKLDESVRTNGVKVATQIQYQALVKSSVLTAQLNAGRLTESLRAQALTSRGIQYDNLGRFDTALKDFEHSLEIAPDSVETLNASIVNAVLLKNYPRALELASKVLAKNPSDAEARNMRALANYFSKDYIAARADFDELLKDRSQVRRGYPVVWLSLVASQNGLEASRRLAPFPDDQLPSEWPRPLVDWALGKASAESVIASAKQGSGAAQRLCEAYYYLGEKYLATGDSKRAREFFQKAVDQGITEFIEDGSARNRLASIER